MCRLKPRGSQGGNVRRLRPETDLLDVKTLRHASTWGPEGRWAAGPVRRSLTWAPDAPRTQQLDSTLEQAAAGGQHGAAGGRRLVTERHYPVARVMADLGAQNAT